MDYWGCGGFVGGETAISQYKDGFFKKAGHVGSTFWKRGTNQGIVTFKLELEIALASNKESVFFFLCRGSLEV